MDLTEAPDVVVITGATAGVGRATAREFAAHGAAIALLARGAEGLDATAKEIEEVGGIALPIRCDMAVADDVFAAAERIERELGPITIWINNAMATVFGPISDLDPEELRRVTDVTYHGQAFGTMAALRCMRRRGHGTIVSVGSSRAHRGLPLQAPYCGAEQAITGFLESLRAELLHDDVDIHIAEVHLPSINTPQFSWSASHLSVEPQPVPPVYQPEEAARAIHWAAHHRRRDVFVGAPGYRAILGKRVVPGFLERYLARRSWDAQLSKVGNGHNEEGNLFFPSPRDHGAHGRFERAQTRAMVRSEASGSRLALLGGLVVLAAVGLGALFRRRWI